MVEEAIIAVVTGKAKAKRGFAAMSKEKVRAIARAGGSSVPNESRSFSKNRELARAAGRKGGEATGRKAKKAVAK